MALTTQLRGLSLAAHVAPRPCGSGARRSVAPARAAAAAVEVEAPPPPPVEEKPLSKWKVLVPGSTGGTGRAVVELLSQRGASVRALARDTTKAGSSLAGVGVTTEIIKGDVYEYGSLPPALAGANAIICATGARDVADPLGPLKVDYEGTLNLIAAAKQHGGIKHFILISSIGADELLNPLNLFWGVLFWKKRAEEELQRSGIPYTIIRPGGLLTTRRQGQTSDGNIEMGRAGTYGALPAKRAGSILRSQVAEVAVGALTEPAAANKVVEVIAKKDAPARTLAELYGVIEY